MECNITNEGCKVKVVIEFSFDASLLSGHDGDEERIAGMNACWTGEKFSNNWSPSKKTGYFISRFSTLAMQAQALEKDIACWNNNQPLATNSVTIKRCPYCGAEPKLQIDSNNRYYLKCRGSDCRVNPESKHFKNTDKAFSNWDKEVDEWKIQSKN